MNYLINLRLGLGIRVSIVVKVRVKVRFKIRFDAFVAVPASDHSAELPPGQKTQTFAILGEARKRN
jgi:hypothetical protein